MHAEGMCSASADGATHSRRAVSPTYIPHPAMPFVAHIPAGTDTEFHYPSTGAHSPCHTCAWFTMHMHMTRCYTLTALYTYTLHGTKHTFWGPSFATCRICKIS